MQDKRQQEDKKAVFKKINFKMLKKWLQKKKKKAKENAEDFRCRYRGRA